MAALGLFVLALGLLGWRGVAVFTAPAAPETASPFASLVETVTGPGTVRIGTGETGQMLVLIDGPPGALSNAQLSQIRQMAGALYPDAPPPSIRQYPFAEGLAPRPSTAALGELGALALLTVIAGWFALTVAPLRATSSQMTPASPSNASERRATPSAVTGRRTAHSPAETGEVDAAMALAAKDPRAAAAMIKTWLSAESGHA